MIVVVGTIAIPALLAWAVAIELGEQVRQKITGKRGDL